MKVSVEDLIVVIPKKQEGLITGKQLSEMFGVEECTIRRIINEARASGIPICSKRWGYYFSDECEDITATIQFLTHRINTQLQAIEGLKKKIH